MGFASSVRRIDVVRGERSGGRRDNRAWVWEPVDWGVVSILGRVGVVGVRRPCGRADVRFGVDGFGRCDIGEGVCADSLADCAGGTAF